MNSIGPVGGASGNSNLPDRKFPGIFVRRKKPLPPESGKPVAETDEFTLSPEGQLIDAISTLAAAQARELMADPKFLEVLGQMQAETRRPIDAALKKQAAE